MLIHALMLLGAALATRQAPGDTARSDTTKRTTLAPVEVRVTRAAEDRARLPMAVGVLGGDALRRAQLTSGLDESLSRLPGVVVQNRYNFSLDQRVSLRGAGSRANFGLRGVKVLLDGVPQTLPDGQSQLTNLELGIVSRAEVLTGSAGALYGNASSRMSEVVPSDGSLAYGGYPDIDVLYKQQARETDKKKREALLHQIQRLLHERVRYAPIYEYIWPSGIGPRVADPALMLINPYPWSAPLEDVKLKKM